MKLILTFSLMATVLFSGSLCAQWTEDTSVNTVVCDIANSKTYPEMIHDGEGGFFMVWVNQPGSPTIQDIHAQHIDANGLPLWGSDGVVVCNEVRAQTHPLVVADGEGGIFVAWTDNRDAPFSDSNLHKPALARLNAEGVVLWSHILEPNTYLVFMGLLFPISIVEDTEGGVYVSWTAHTATLGIEIHMQRIDANGNALWPEILSVSNHPSKQEYAQLVADGNGGCFVGWNDARNGNSDFYGQHVTPDGDIMWEPSGKPLIDEFNNSNYEYIMKSDGQNGIYIGYGRRIDPDPELNLYAQRFNSAGEGLWGDYGISVVSAPEAQVEMDITTDSFNNLIATWSDNRSEHVNATDTYVQLINLEGIPQWTTDGVLAIPHGSSTVRFPRVATDGAGGAIVNAYNPNYSGDNIWQIQLGHVSAAGVANPNITFASSSSADSKVVNRILPTVPGEVLSLWAENRGGTFTQKLLYCQKTTFDLSTSVNNATQNLSISLWPNPADDKIYLHTSAPASRICISDIQGRNVQDVPFANTVDIAPLAPGVYILSTGQSKLKFVKR